MILQVLAWGVVIFGIINLVRMTFFIIWSDIYSLRVHIQKKKRKKHAPLNHEFPLVSVVIPAHNEESTILRCLQSVHNSEYPLKKIEIIVVDDGSTDQTSSVVEHFILSHKRIHMRLVRISNGGKARALNRGMREYARGEIIMCLDADSVLDSLALRRAVVHFENPNIVAIAANVKIMPTKSLLNLIQQFEYLISYQMKKAQTTLNIEYIIGGVGSVFRRSMLERVGFYDTNTVTEDIDLTMKIIREGNIRHRVVYCSDVIAYTEGVMNIKSLLSQRFRWKWGRMQTFWKNRYVFFNSDSKYSKLLTWFWLPHAIYSELAFFFEPILVSFIFYIVVRYQDMATLLSAMIVISFYISMNVLMEETIPWKQKILFVFLSPSMYVLFYVLSFIEYVALIQSIRKLPFIREELHADVCGWNHVERSGVVLQKT